MYISSFHKIAGKAEAKKVNGLNFEELRKKLTSEGLEPTSEEIKEKLLDESNLAISNHEKDLILNLNLSDSSRKRVNEIEAALIIIGAVLSNSSNYKEIIDTFNWYLETKELSPGSLNIATSSIFNVDSIKDTFNNLYEKVEEEKRKSDEIASSSKNDNYLSNEVVYDFGDGWRVVYVPAAGEMEEFPGLAGTSHDRILEGNKNGLCLGNQLKYYQNNDQGKIYSIRDPINKPMVTIRIDGDSLEEAKGKSNNAPDVESAEKTDIWLKTLEESNENFNYKDNEDYLKFPPLDIDKAKELFSKNKDNSYESGWVHHWYGKGIDKLDEDVDDKIKNNDPILITSGFGKNSVFFEKIKPVVIYWCNRYPKSKKILFGTEYYPPYHEVFKTYKKLPEMQEAVRKFAEEKKNAVLFFESGIYKIKEYEKYIDNLAKYYAIEKPIELMQKYHREYWAQPYLADAARFMAKADYRDFLENFSEESWAKPFLGLASNIFINKNPSAYFKLFHKKPWAEPYLDRAIKESAKQHPKYFLKNFTNIVIAKPYISMAVNSLLEEDPNIFLKDFTTLPWASDYIEIAIEKALQINPNVFLKHFSKDEWAQPYISKAAEKSAEINPLQFLASFSFESWSKDYLGMAAKNAIEENVFTFLGFYSNTPWAQPYLDLASKKSIEENPYKFLIGFSEEPWAQPYVDAAAKKVVETEPDVFLRSFGHIYEEPWANTPVDSIGGKTWLEYAKERLKAKKASSIDVKLKKLSKFLLNNRCLEESITLKRLL